MYTITVVDHGNGKIENDKTYTEHNVVNVVDFLLIPEKQFVRIVGT